MPSSIVQRANQILSDLEGGRESVKATPSAATDAHTSAPTTVGSGKATVSAPSGMQLSFFQLDDPVLEQIRDEVKTLDINNLTPLEALNKLSEIKKLVGGK
jgi:DNA mismatch repair protein MutS